MKTNLKTMEAKDLRIGNYAHWKSGGIAQVRYILEKAIGLIDDIESDLATPLSLFEPIPLTEQWLIDFGFKVNNDCGGNGFQLGNMILFKVHESSNDWFYEVEYHYKNFDKRTTIIGRYDYVHQLQNLYFALTNKELIKK